ncbi:MAG: hypothetical protein IKH27_11565 [Oscillospiraceae bacterium]|nr:hypothetical protein [Oscillospiraceae bacterium]
MTLYQIPGVKEMIRSELPYDVKKKSLIQKMDDLFATSYKQTYMTDTHRNSTDLVDRIWLYASLIDAALSEKTKYAPEKYGCKNEWEMTVRWLRFELRQRKLLSGRMIHDVAGLCSKAADSLDCLKPESCGQSLVDWIRKNGESLTELYEIVSDLRFRLKNLAETYGKYQLSLNPD